MFGSANLAAFVFAPVFGRFGSKIGPKLLYTSGAYVQAVAGICLGLLTFVDDTGAFIGLSYFLR